uniref:Pentatricopeptide repeat-containing protein n=1 Tax=Cannabis sativa TaxID=3483 RepID=A0A803Q4Z2_CANSA
MEKHRALGNQACSTSLHRISSMKDVEQGIGYRYRNPCIIGKKCYKVEGYLGNALVDMYAKCGKLNSAREVFDELKMKPGLVEEGRQYFDRMIQQYNIKPDIKHYGCMIDLLSRWGFLYEAYEMIKTRSGETSSVIWRTLLGACTVHRNMDMAEKCFQQLAELDLLKDADYVLLSNIYAEAERWDDVERLRNEMVTAGVVKILGYSHIGEGDFK